VTAENETQGTPAPAPASRPFPAYRLTTRRTQSGAPTYVGINLNAVHRRFKRGLVYSSSDSARFFVPRSQALLRTPEDAGRIAAGVFVPVIALVRPRTRSTTPTGNYSRQASR
jgi:hypothetical protein